MIKVQLPDVSYSFEVIGAPPPQLRDAYHGLLRLPTWVALSVVIGVYLFLNLLFAALYLLVGGVANASSFLDLFFFSVHTMATIGYGTMYPATRVANVLVVGESILGLLITAMVTGLVFFRFSLTRARVVFSQRAVISPMDGVPTLQLRLGNERRNRIFDAHFRITFSHTTRTSEGVTVYRSQELTLVRNHAPSLAQSWNLNHRIEGESPLVGETPQSLAAGDAEILVALSGTDEHSLQPIHGRSVYEHTKIIWGARLTDVLSETPEGNVRLDLTKFHLLTATPATANFPYSATPEQLRVEPRD